MTLARIEETQLLILGIDQRLVAREDKLTKTLEISENAENEERKYETAAAAVATAVQT